MFVMAGVSFWGGGKLISESENMDRLSGEMLGLLIALVVGALGYALRRLGDLLGPDGDSVSQ